MLGKIIKNTHRKINYVLLYGTKNYCFRIFFFCNILLCFINNACGSTAIKKLSNPEKIWVIKHPFIAYKTFKITTYALAVSKEKEVIEILDKYENGGKLDAFRHIFWMACLANKIGAKRALSLGNAHEAGNYIQFKKAKLEEGALPDEASSKMDSLNNIIGVNIGLLWRNAHFNDDKNEIIKYINNGTAYIILRNEKGNFINCNHQEILQMNNQKNWKNNKCVVLLSTVKQ